MYTYTPTDLSKHMSIRMPLLPKALREIVEEGDQCDAASDGDYLFVCGPTHGHDYIGRNYIGHTYSCAAQRMRPAACGLRHAARGIWHLA